MKIFSAQTGRLILLLFFLCLLPSSPSRAADPPLELWIHPYLHAPELVRRFTPLAHYLEAKTGRKIEIKISSTYENHKARLGEDRADIAFVGPFSYVQMTEGHGGKTILATVEGNGKALFHGVIAVRRDGLGGFYDAGGLKEEVFHEYAPRGLRILVRSPPIPEHLFLAGKKLPAPLVESLRRALLQLKDPAVLTPIQTTATGLVPATDRDYDGLRHIARNLGPMPGE